jgi:hypothetical protein
MHPASMETFLIGMSSVVTNMSFMFYAASRFNQNLCNWGKKIYFSNTLLVSIFDESGCSNTKDPTGPNGPFCVGAEICQGGESVGT